MFQLAQSSPLVRLDEPLLRVLKIKLYLKREDQIHPEVSGNKWRKLKYNFIEARSKKYASVLTFGGAYSNHIAATAAAAKQLNFHSIGIIRGEELNPYSNPTLQKASHNGMKLIFISRDEYRKKEDPDWLLKLQTQYQAFVIPEGGTNNLALKGVKELVSEVNTPFEFIACAVGTGGTLAGITKALKTEKALGFATVNAKRDLENKIGDLINMSNASKWHLFDDYHFGGYGKFNKQLIDFMNEFYQVHKILLDPIYTGKMMFGIYDLIQQGYFPIGSGVIAVHTGGLQGIKGFNERHGNILLEQ